MPEFCSEEVTARFIECRKSHQSRQSFTQLLEIFDPAIQRMSVSFAPSWQNDLCQEGRAALWNAVQKFPTGRKTSLFFPYAILAIWRAMLSFNRTTIQAKIEFEALPYIQDENSCSVNSDIPDANDLIVASSQKIDFDYFFKDDTEKAGFTPKEKKAFDLHYRQGFKGIEIAPMLKVTSPRASRIIRSAREKATRILATYTISI